jgi:hypothetical protein
VDTAQLTGDRPESEERRETGFIFGNTNIFSPQECLIIYKKKKKDEGVEDDSGWCCLN